jgi:CheY-like chemotaxis protein
MENKLNSIMIIDDNKFDNLYHERVIINNNFTKNVILKESGKDALSFLKNTNNIIPEIIFLDINMPTMNGWEFLSEYKKLDDKLKSKIIIIMQSNPEEVIDDYIELIKFSSTIVEFKTKPLNKEILDEISNLL